MADIADTAGDAWEVISAALIANAGSGAPRYESTGRCLNCDAEVEPERRWCDKDCMQDFLRRSKA